MTFSGKKGRQGLFFDHFQKNRVLRPEKAEFSRFKRDRAEKSSNSARFHEKHTLSVKRRYFQLFS